MRHLPEKAAELRLELIYAIAYELSELYCIEWVHNTGSGHRGALVQLPGPGQLSQAHYGILHLHVVQL